MKRRKSSELPLGLSKEHLHFDGEGVVLDEPAVFCGLRTKKTSRVTPARIAIGSELDALEGTSVGCRGVHMVHYPEGEVHLNLLRLVVPGIVVHVEENGEEVPVGSCVTVGV